MEVLSKDTRNEYWSEADRAFRPRTPQEVAPDLGETTVKFMSDEHWDAVVGELCGD